MKRKFDDLLLQWANSEPFKPLLVYGARQVGKTYSMRKFGSTHYEDMLYVIFDRTITESTLFFFDEIQFCEQALTSLKYFNEDAPTRRILAAGSLPSVALSQKERSFPVGKITSYVLKPMDFEEFLWALHEEPLLHHIRRSYILCAPLVTVFHEKALTLFRLYLALGGMPEVVSIYASTGSLQQADMKLNEIYTHYINDMGKYASPSDVPKIRMIYQSIVPQLAKPNKNFKYTEVQKGKTKEYFGSSIAWLDNAEIGYRSHLVESPRYPLTAHIHPFIFRLFVNDCGLLRVLARVPIQNIMNEQPRDNITGIITETYIASELRKNDLPLYYHTGGRNTEIDFLVQGSGEIIPIEVKSGTRVQSISLKRFMEEYNPSKAYRISARNFGSSGGITSIPLYAFFYLAADLAKDALPMPLPLL